MGKLSRSNGHPFTYLVLFILTIVWQLTQMTIWMTLESVLLLVIFIIGWIILSIQQVHARSQLEAAHLQLVAYAMRIEELTLVNERQRLARELHDTLAQDLVGLTLQLERVDLHLEKKRFERARELVQQAMARARTTLAEARSAIDDLRANTLNPHDLLLAIQREINRFTEATSISCMADIAAFSALPENLCQYVLRAITEGLTNVARHSQAHQVWVCAQFQEAILTIEVRDDGIGFDSTAVATQEGHYGLLGLRERARLCGGHLDIESAVGKGTVLRLHLPVTTRGSYAAHGVSSSPASLANNTRRETDLTERELEVLEGLVRGERNKEIAMRLGVTERTVRAHLSTIYMKLNVDSRAQAAAVAIERGLVSPRTGSYK
jgi:signal transduction histidine kinase/DNA-binding CsgD family transcriptional regulator